MKNQKEVCAGGGGIPVLRRDDGSMVGIEAVIDKDAASALLARQLGADALLLLTDVDAVHRDFGTDQSTPLAELTVAEAQALPGEVQAKVHARQALPIRGRE